MSKVIPHIPSSKQIIFQKSSEAAVLLLLFVAVYIMNSLFPVYLDDWSYSKMMNGSEIGGILDIIRNQYNHYFTWGGRSVVHTIAQILLYLGKPWSNILNTIAYIAFIWIIYRLATLRTQRNALYIIIIHCFIWFFTPSLGECIFWKTGSANYLWGTLIFISFLYIHCSFYLKGNNYKEYSLFGMFFFGIIAGWTNENMAVALLFFLIMLSIMLRIEKRRIPKWMIFGIAGVLIGAIFMLAAPGNFVRYSESDMTEGEPIYRFLFYRTVSTMIQFSRHCLWPIIIYMIVSALHLKFGYRRDKKNIFRLSWLLFATAMVATVAMIAAPIFPERVWFGIIAIILTGGILQYANLYSRSNLLKIVNIVICTVITGLFAISYYQGYQHLTSVDRIWEKRAEEVTEQKRKNVKNVILYGKYKADMRLLSLPKVSDIPLDSTEWIGRSYGNYLGVKSVTTVEEDIKD